MFKGLSCNRGGLGRAAAGNLPGAAVSLVARTYSRIVKSDPPPLQDFLSDQARGRPVPNHPELRRLHNGLSAYATLAQARRKAEAFPILGRYIAAIRIPEGAAVTIERTLGGSRGHHTVRGDAGTLLGCVELVVGV